MLNRRRAGWPLLAYFLTACCMGCQPSPSAPGPSAEARTELHSDIPLRVWVVAQVGNVELLQRQWLANSEQPLQVRQLTQAELLQEPSCDCDVLLYPSGLIGELIQRQWIVKLPDGVFGSRLGESSDYGRVVMGVSLGRSIPVFVASEALRVDARPLSWEAVLEQLQVTRTATPQFNFAATEVDHAALVDRFLALVASVSQRDPGYGLLFDLQTMRSRLTEQEFLSAAELLAALAAQPEGLVSVIGSHSTVWQWAATNPSAALAIAPATLLDAASAQIATGQIVDVRAGPDVATGPLSATPSPGNNGANRAATSTTTTAQSGLARPRVLTWNTGEGLVASVSSRCRQSSQANVLLGWLDQAGTRSLLADLVAGVEGASGSDRSESLVAQARQALAQRLTEGGISLEPRLPAASQYRQALAEELVSFLAGNKNASQALAEADRRWNEISQRVGSEQRRHYERSLNLSR